MLTPAEVLNVEAVAALLQCTPETVRDQAQGLGGLKFGRDWIFPRQALLELLNERARKAAAAKREPKPAPGAVLHAVPAKQAPPALPSLDGQPGPRRAGRRTAAPSLSMTTP